MQQNFAKNRLLSSTHDRLAIGDTLTIFQISYLSGAEKINLASLVSRDKIKWRLVKVP